MTLEASAYLGTVLLVMNGQSKGSPRGRWCGWLLAGGLLAGGLLSGCVQTPADFQGTWEFETDEEVIYKQVVKIDSSGAFTAVGDGSRIDGAVTTSEGVAVAQGAVEAGEGDSFTFAGECADTNECGGPTSAGDTFTFVRLQ